jgi:hypothetical protein
MRSRVLLPFVGLLLVAAVYEIAAAHHSRAAYDATRDILLTGTIAEIDWRNPHIYITLEVENDGRRTLQEVEVGPLSTLQPLGLTRQSMQPGETVTVRANPNRRGPGHVVVGLDLSKPNGETYPLHVVGRGQSAPAAVPAASLAGRWVPVSDDFMGIVRGSRDWPLTPDARAAALARGGDSQRECTPWPAPLLMALPMLRVVEVTADAVNLRFDWMAAVRTVRLDLDAHPADLEPSLQGLSIGRWDGDTLVIDTQGFTPHPEGAGFGVPAGPRKRLLERLTLGADKSSLTYEFTVEDPSALTEPKTYSMRWVHRPDLEPSGEECDLEVARRLLDE